MKKELTKLLEKSYSPYSGVKVSCVIFTKDGKEYRGVNVENSVYSPTNCAERTAIFSAIADGKGVGDFKELHLFSNLDRELYPCGVCRQVMSEFFELETPIFVYSPKLNEPIKTSLKQIYPHSVVKGSFE